MKHKRLLLILGCLMSVLLAGYVTLRLSAPRHRITADNIQAIRAGMTAKEVEEILGAPPGYYCSRKDEEVIAVIAPGCLEAPTTTMELERTSDRKFWVSDEGGIWIRLREDGKVATVIRLSVPNAEETFLAKLRRWLG